MPIYDWKATDSKGKVQTGEHEAENEAAVRSHLQRMRLTPVKIKKQPKDLLPPKVTNNDVIMFARQFSTMIDAGLPLVQCLEILYSQSDNSTFKRILKKVKEGVEGGATLADALREFPNTFDELFVNMIEAGESGGILDTILNRLSGYLEKAAKLKAKIKGAMMYPIIVLGISAIVIGIILVFVIPVFEEMFTGMEKALPLPTQIVVNVSDFTCHNILWIILGTVGFVYAYRYFYKTDFGNRLMDDLFLKLPVVGMMIRKVSVAKFTRTLATMLGSGVSILDALEIVAKTAGNRTIESAVYSVRSSIEEGSSMVEPLTESGVFPSMVVQMIGVGESTGALDSMLEKIANFYDDEVDQAVDNMTTMIEPLMIAFLGFTIGGLVVAMYLPVFQMAGAIE
ncbi:MAG: Type 4 fimbrial assembly protein pilC [Candidatus Magnetoglobus multicellularis str. Araruama]|uniref:Type 4 fimbrial assembly protein pilC n=1 Tax=Candidatus Magnetoglobus multicellularis str. Araruama TaxID=890399 RepID=A0A1V1PDY0_9BACT|nr:MAG: Type 4 fimbrial assembly protein pilC [Candidatus Magnetoglobus multicellularis str. Araruama]